MKELNRNNKLGVSAGVARYTGSLEAEWHSEVLDLIRANNLKPKRIVEKPRFVFRTERQIDFYQPEIERPILRCITKPVYINGTEYQAGICQVVSAVPDATREALRNSFP